MLLGALVGRQVLVAAALRKISTHAYSSLIAKRPCLLNQVMSFCWKLGQFRLEIVVVDLV